MKIAAAFILLIYFILVVLSTIVIKYQGEKVTWKGALLEGPWFLLCECWIGFKSLLGKKNG